MSKHDRGGRFERAQWVIRGHYDDIDETTLYWNNEDGWVDRASATIFSERERRTARLPIGGAWARHSASRPNPELLVLFNPSEIPDEDEARSKWQEFHLRSGDNAEVISIPDIAGLPKTVVVIGCCEGVELVRSRDEVDRKDHREVMYARSPSGGPWLVTDAKAKRLWIVARAPLPGRDWSASDGFVKAVYYYPPKQSGKHDAERAYRHEFGETGEGGRPSRQWPRYYPEWRRVSDRAIEFLRPSKGFTIEDIGIVG